MKPTLQAPSTTKSLAKREPDSEPLPVILLVEFCRALIRNHPSGDVLFLGLAAAQAATGATDEEMELLKIAVLDVADKSPWPKGFF